jgi:hypothetical protein
MLNLITPFLNIELCGSLNIYSLIYSLGSRYESIYEGHIFSFSYGKGYYNDPVKMNVSIRTLKEYFLSDITGSVSSVISSFESTMTSCIYDFFGVKYTFQNSDIPNLIAFADLIVANRLMGDNLILGKYQYNPFSVGGLVKKKIGWRVGCNFIMAKHFGMRWEFGAFPGAAKKRVYGSWSLLLPIRYTIGFLSSRILS